MADKYGILDYSTVDKTWQLKSSEMSTPINLTAGDVIRLGILQGRAVKAVLLKDIDGSWIWAISEIVTTPEVGGMVALEAPA